MQAYRTWLERHLQEALAEYNRIQAADETNEEDRELYERVHQMWGYVAALEKCLKEYDALERLKPSVAP